VRNWMARTAVLVGFMSVATAAQAVDPKMGARPANPPAAPAVAQPVAPQAVIAQPAADLAIAQIQVNPPAREGQAVQGVSVVVRNQGHAAGQAGAVKLSCRAAAGSACPPGLASIMLPLAPVAPGAMATIMVPPNGRDVWAAGKLTLIAEIVGAPAGKSQSLDLSVVKQIATELRGLNPQPEPPRPNHAAVAPIAPPVAGTKPAPPPPSPAPQGLSQAGLALSQNAAAQAIKNASGPFVVCQSAVVYKDQACTQPISAGETILPQNTPAGAETWPIIAWVLVTLKNQGFATSNAFMVKESVMDMMTGNGSGPQNYVSKLSQANNGPYVLKAGSILKLETQWQATCPGSKPHTGYTSTAVIRADFSVNGHSGECETVQFVYSCP
jgi:hypothetical protein